MKKYVFRAVAGIFLLLAAIVCPFPPLLGVPGVVWRAVTGVVGTLLMSSGASRALGLGGRASGRRRR